MSHLAGILLGIISLFAIVTNKADGQYGYGYEYDNGLNYPYPYPFGGQSIAKNQNKNLGFSMAPVSDSIRSIENTRIVGGRPADIESFKHVCAIIYNNELLCTGSLISNIFVLTAAHDIFRKRTRGFMVRCGSESFKSGGATSAVSKIVMHGNFNKYTYANDIAIMKLKEPLVGPTISPISLSSSYDIPSFGTIAGWGTVEANDELDPSPSFYLRAVEVGVINLRICRNIHYGVPIADDSICAGQFKGGRDFCLFDDGAGLISGKNLVGVASRSTCGKHASPSIYVWIPLHKKWLTDVIHNILNEKNYDEE